MFCLSLSSSLLSMIQWVNVHLVQLMMVITSCFPAPPVVNKQTTTTSRLVVKTALQRYLYGMNGVTPKGRWGGDIGREGESYIILNFSCTPSCLLSSLTDPIGSNVLISHLYCRFIVRFPIGLDFLFITFTILLHVLLSWTSSLSISSSAISTSTLSNHVFLGLPTSLLPSTLYSIHFFTQSSSPFLITCPYHLSLPLLMKVVICSTPTSLLNSSFVLLDGTTFVVYFGADILSSWIH